MVTLVKHEWHNVDVQYAIDLDTDLLQEIYPDMDEDAIDELLVQIETGYKDIEEIINDALDNDVELEWEHQNDDMWTMRKGGYDVTYELGDEDSWHYEPPPPDPTHKCTKCKWTGQEYDATWHWPEDENEESKKICPMCDSDIELTEAGLEKEKQYEELNRELDNIRLEDEDEPK